MSTNVANTTPYLLSTRSFSKDSTQLSEELSRAYIDIANAVNARTIGIFTNNRPIITGEGWFTQGGSKKQQSLRQIYPFVFANLPNIAHGINISQISGFIRIWGTYVDSGGTWYPLPFVSATAVANQVQIQVNATNIVVTVGAGAPVPVSGFLILEWLSSV